MKRETIFSQDRIYRYTLWREWVTSGDLLSHEDALSNSSFVQVIGLNPSTADETKDDPTIRRCIGFAKSWGYGALCMTNLFAYRATDPKAMMIVEDPMGLANRHWLLEIGKHAGIIIAAWGVHGVHKSMNSEVWQWFDTAGLKLHCLGKTKDGHPAHPLYLPKTCQPVPL